jgi:hypothetical protein
MGRKSPIYIRIHATLLPKSLVTNYQGWRSPSRLLSRLSSRLIFQYVAKPIAIETAGRILCVLMLTHSSSRSKWLAIRITLRSRLKSYRRGLGVSEQDVSIGECERTEGHNMLLATGVCAGSSCIDGEVRMVNQGIWTGLVLPRSRVAPPQVLA